MATEERDREDIDVDATVTVFTALVLEWVYALAVTAGCLEGKESARDDADAVADTDTDADADADVDIDALAGDEAMACKLGLLWMPIRARVSFILFSRSCRSASVYA